MQKSGINVLSGIQPSGKLHIGNYFGALKQWIELQDAHAGACAYCIVDLHAITVPYKADELKQRVFDTAVDFLALGLDPKKAILFVQSHLPEHSELMWLLNTLIPVAELERMTQYKDKSQKHHKNISAGLLNYPVLMAADILLYKAMLVPVGEDQVQHVELSRVIARKFNNAFGETFPEPKPQLTQGARIMSLSDPMKKMSKSDGEKSYIALDDDPKTIESKLKKAVTDTGGDGPGPKNLMTILELVDAEGATDFAKQIADGSIKYAELKSHLAEKLADHFANYRSKRAEIAKNPSTVWDVLKDGADRARKVASATLAEVKENMGFRY